MCSAQMTPVIVMPANKPRADTRRPHEELLDLMLSEIGETLTAATLRLFIRANWKRARLLAHRIHEEESDNGRARHGYALEPAQRRSEMRDYTHIKAQVMGKYIAAFNPEISLTQNTLLEGGARSDTATFTVSDAGDVIVCVNTGDGWKSVTLTDEGAFALFDMLFECLFRLQVLAQRVVSPELANLAYSVENGRG